jgi:hypothetical protein
VLHQRMLALQRQRRGFWSIIWRFIWGN